MRKIDGNHINIVQSTTMNCQNLESIKTNDLINKVLSEKKPNLILKCVQNTWNDVVTCLENTFQFISNQKNSECNIKEKQKSSTSKTMHESELLLKRNMEILLIEEFENGNHELGFDLETLEISKFVPNNNQIQIFRRRTNDKGKSVNIVPNKYVERLAARHPDQEFEGVDQETYDFLCKAYLEGQFNNYDNISNDDDEKMKKEWKEVDRAYHKVKPLPIATNTKTIPKRIKKPAEKPIEQNPLDPVLAQKIMEKLFEKEEVTKEHETEKAEKADYIFHQIIKIEEENLEIQRSEIQHDQTQKPKKQGVMKVKFVTHMTFEKTTKKISFTGERINKQYENHGRLGVKSLNGNRNKTYLVSNTHSVNYEKKMAIQKHAANIISGALDKS